MEQLQGSLCSSLQGDPNILKDLEDQRLCSKRTLCINQCVTFHRDAAGPHPGAGEYRNGYTSWQNIGRAAHEDDIGAIKPGLSPHCKICNRTSRERPAEKSGHRSTTAKQVHRASSNLNLSDPTSSQDRNVYSRSGQKFDPTGYWSSHDYKVEEAHTSAMCRFPNNGHNKLDTRLDIKGGQTWNRRGGVR